MVSLVILQTKLIIPPLNAQLVQRPRISEKIDAGIHAGHKLTLVAAPAGFGKSTAVSIWAHQTQSRVTWLALDEGDNESSVFWAYLITAVQTIFPDFAAPVFSALTASPPAPPASILPTVVNELAALDEPIVLIFDDYHVIANKEIHDSIAFLLEHQPQNFHLIISTRGTPPCRWRDCAPKEA